MLELVISCGRGSKKITFWEVEGLWVVVSDITTCKFLPSYFFIFGNVQICQCASF